MVTTDEVQRAAAGWTIPRFLHRNATEFGDRPALTLGDTTLTWAHLRAEVAAVAAGLQRLGVGRGDRVLIAMSKRPEHWIVDLAAVHLGAIPCTTYDTLSPEQVSYAARNSAAPVIVLEGAAQLATWGPILGDLPALKHIVVVDDEPGHVQYAELHSEAADLDALAESIRPDDPVCMIYTSGTTGDPKGVVLSHHNVLYQAVMLDLLVPVGEHPRSVAYLPMAHVAERVLGIYLPLSNAGHVHICADPAQLVPTLAAVRPNGFFGVPRVWEKMAAGLAATVRSLPDEQQAAVESATTLTRQVHAMRRTGEAVPPELTARHTAIDDAVLRPIRARLGLDVSTRNLSGAAPIPVAVLEYLDGFGLIVGEVWGMSETAGCATVSTAEAGVFGGVGRPGPGVEVRLADDGEILIRGPIVFLGYLQPDGTIEPGTDAEGWLATGDIGTVDDDGILHITDRKKEILITASGKNVAPAQVEGLLRAHPLLSQAVAIGDRRPYISALLVLDEEAAPAWAAAQGIEASDLANHPAVQQELDVAVKDANSRLSRAEQIKRYTVLGTPWTAESGELTPTLKLRRRVISDRYATEIDNLYSE